MAATSEDTYTIWLSDARSVQEISWPEAASWGWKQIDTATNLLSAKQAIDEQGLSVLYGWPRATKVEPGYVVMQFVFDPEIKTTRLCLIVPAQWMTAEAQS